MIHSGAHRHEDQNPADLAWSTVLFPPTRPCSLCYTQAPDKATARGLRWTPSGSRIGSETVSHDGTATRLLQRKPHARSSANASRLAAGRHGSVWPFGLESVKGNLEGLKKGGREGAKKTHSMLMARRKLRRR